MRILHCMLSCFYIDNYKYQENILPIVNKMDGHDVKIIASTETYVDNINLKYVKPSRYFNEADIEVVRVPYKKYLPQVIMRKLRLYKGVYKLIEEFNPDVILFHGMPAGELKTIKKYVKKHPHVKLFIDSHEDYNNSATNMISKYLLHRLYYKWILKSVLPYVYKVLSISYETTKFIQENYNIPVALIEKFPLGGELLTEAEKTKIKIKVRNELKIEEDDLVIIHSGKMDAKKKTLDIIKAFREINDLKSKLLIVGEMSEEVYNEALPYFEVDKRIYFLGWKESDKLREYIAAADLYIQPGGQSATMQTALCVGTPVAIYPHISYKELLNGMPYYVSNQADIEVLFKEIQIDKRDLKNRQRVLYDFAKNNLDYREITKILY